jgi:two-component system CheB/CheR fusion protein
VEGDPTRLEQIIWNLLHNALKFTRQNTRIQIILGINGDHAQLQVIDNGIGLAPADIEHVFDLFSQAKPRTSAHQRDGLGIGLSLVRQLVQAHDGSVSVRSAGVGHGCAFTVLLPLSDQAPHVDPDVPKAEQKGRLKGLKILLVDDSPEVIEVMRMLLEMEDALVKSFSEPLLALHNATDEHYDIILSDIGMPVMDGHELIQSLRQTKLHKFTPAIALTGYGVAVEAQKAKSAGFDRHLCKPVQYEELVETIETLCSSMLE